MRIARIILVLLVILSAGAYLVSHRTMPVSPMYTATNADVSSTATSTATSTGVTPPVVPPTPHAAQGVVNGTVMLGPTCPVEQNPPQPQCADRGYQTSVHVQSHSGTVKTITTDATGHFSVSLDVGSYTLTAVSKGVLPTCRPEGVTVIADRTQTVTLYCDTGIR